MNMITNRMNIHFRDIHISDRVFWVTYYIFSLFFDFKYKTTKYIKTDDIFQNVFWNMIYTGTFQSLFYFIIPQGMLDLQFVIYRFIVSVMITEVIFFYTRKLLHLTGLYKYYKPHHLFVEPCAFSALYCHPIEAVLCNQLAITVGPVITGMGLYEIMIWSALTAVNTLKAHFRSKRPFFNSRYHDIHHQEHNKNFGFMYLLDIAHGTCKLSTY